MYEEAKEQYRKALRQGQKYMRGCLLRDEDPYPAVLDSFVSDEMIAGTIDLGVMEIPAELVIGTKTAGRRTAFAGNFMPLLSVNTEFGFKWVQLCAAHLGDEGIRDPVECYEYLGKFYVEEGNKRVSVLKSFDAPTIPARVLRLMPVKTGAPEIEAYYAFTRFYQMSGMYQLNLPEVGGYARLQAALGYEPEHVWTAEERSYFLAGYVRFRDAFQRLGGEELKISAAQALLVWLQLHPFSELKTMNDAAIRKSLGMIWLDVKLQTAESRIAISTQPAAQERKRRRRGHVNVAFIHMHRPETSLWVASHELGRKAMEEKLGDAVTVTTYSGVQPAEAEQVMEQAVAEGAEVLFATAPPLMRACRMLAAAHPEVKVLNCALSMPYSGVRTYYSRIYEGKFLAGAIAGAMSKTGKIGYVANYPIFGVPAGINAFAIGAQMTNPNARVQLRWTCVEEPGSFDRQVDVISNREGLGGSGDWEWGTYQRLEDGAQLPLATPTWEWGVFYERIILSILDGGWDAVGAQEQNRAVNYWWGMDSGVIDVKLSPQLPDAVARMARYLKRGIQENALDPFSFRLVDQQGTVRNDGYRWLMADEIMAMDWLCSNVDGEIPHFEALLPMSRNLVRLLGVYRDQIPPETEGGLL